MKIFNYYRVVAGEFVELVRLFVNSSDKELDNNEHESERKKTSRS